MSNGFVNWQLLRESVLVSEPEDDDAIPSRISEQFLKVL